MTDAIATPAMHKAQGRRLVDLMTAAKAQPAPSSTRKPTLAARWEVNGWTAPRPKGVLRHGR